MYIKMKQHSFFRTLLFSALIIFITTTCSHRDDPQPPPKTYPLENPLQKFYFEAGLDKEESLVGFSYEYGLVFSPQVKGEITAFTARLTFKEKARVTLWDYNTRAVIATAIVDVPDKDKVATTEITPVPLEKDKKYLISINSGYYYRRTKSTGVNVPYPVIAGNFIFHSFNLLKVNAQTFPTDTATDYTAGDVSFNFRQTD